jgi:hypothetical protein
METYSTRDFYLIAYLHYLGNRIADARLVNQNSTEFTFKVDEKLKERVNNFYSKNALVDPMDYGSSFRSIKNIIHSLKMKNVLSTTFEGHLNHEANNKKRKYFS